MPAKKPKPARRLKKYRVRVHAVAPCETEVEVEATSTDEAEEMALDMVEKNMGDYKFTPFDAPKWGPQDPDDLEDAETIGWTTVHPVEAQS